MLFVHPGLYEPIRPQHRVIDTTAMMIAVKFEFEFFGQTSGKTWTPLYANAHYHLALGAPPDSRSRRRP
jgi:hypothetical protein